jgi:hypothetical protein
MSNSKLNRSVMTEQPSELVEVICVKPGTCPNCRSSGAVTGSGIKRDDLNRRIIDLRQRGDR